MTSSSLVLCPINTSNIYITYIHIHIYSINPIFILLTKINRNSPVKKVFGLFATNSLSAETPKYIYIFFFRETVKCSSWREDSLDMNWLKQLVITLLDIFQAQQERYPQYRLVKSCGVLCSDFCKPETEVPEGSGVYTQRRLFCFLFVLLINVE